VTEVYDPDRGFEAKMAAKTRIVDWLDSTIEKLDKYLEEVHSIQVRAASANEDVKLAVDHAGHLVKLTFAQNVTTRYRGNAAGLAEIFNQTLQAASVRAADEHHRIGGTGDVEEVNRALAAFTDRDSELWATS
jgi:hypothetical protein